jgi:TonB family protein
MFRLILAIAVAAFVVVPAAASHKPHKRAISAPVHAAPPPVLPDFVEDQPFGARPPNLPLGVDYWPARAIGRTHGNCVYPHEAQEQNQSGSVELSYDVGADGVIGSVVLRKSSGSAILDTAAITCVATIWKSEPALVNSKPIASLHHIAVVRY